MGCLTWSYQVLCLQLLLFYSHASARHCLHEQSSALLQFKQLFSFNNRSSLHCNDENVPSYPKMMSWKESSDCCSWDGVTCDMVTGHVTGLDLSCCWLHGNIPSNTSLFFLPHLQNLNLAFNDFNFSQISPAFSQLSSLTILNLSYSYFEGQIPSEISHLSKLVLLDLSQHHLTLKTPVLEGLSQNLTELRQLSLDHVNMATVIPSSLSNLSSSLSSLSLFYCGMQGNFPNHIFNLPNLQVLHLSRNFNLTGNFPKVNWSSPLKHLDVSCMCLSGALPKSISNLKSLRYLALSHCSLFGSIPTSLGNLTQLTYLDFSSNSFIGTIPDIFVNLTRLSFLSLRDNQLVGPIPSLVSKLPYLVHISFYNNSLNGTIPSWLFTLPLEFIDLSYNQLTGHIEEFHSFSLRSIYLGGNRLHGPIPSSVFELVNLTDLVLFSNNLSGSLELSMFAKLEKLGTIDLSHNRLSIRTTFKANSSLPQLFKFSLSACNISEFPDILKSSNQLHWLDLSDNIIKGQIPNWMWDIGKDTLIHLNLSHNFLTSIEQLPWKNLEILDLHSNLLQGALPNPLPHLKFCSLSNNKLTRTIPHFICNLSAIVIVDLSNNYLSGSIPKCIGNISDTFRVLDLQKNRFNGTIPKTFVKGNHLKTLNLNNNKLEGQVPVSLVNCTLLEVLDIGNNNINDTFPYWLGNLPSLQVLVLHSNKFYGSVRHVSEASNYSFPKLRIFDLSNNNFSGFLPIRYFENMEAMMNVDEIEKELKYMGDSAYKDSVMVTIKGFETVLVKILTIFTTIDLSNNNFHGEIPEIIEQFHALRLLNLSHNNLTGYIPSSFGNLAALESLDLSSNKLVGKLPWQLSRLNFLEVLNLSENQLWGPIPSGNQFATFPTTSYSGNLGLCGFPLPNKCSENDTQPTPSKSEEDAKFWDGFGWKSVLTGYGCGVAFGVSIGYIVFFTGKPRWVVDEVAYWSVQLRGMNMLAKKGRWLNKKREGR